MSGQMKAMKTFVRTCYSESLLVEGANDAENEKAAAADVDPANEKGSNANGASESEIKYHGGLGLKFKFPGDPKK